MDCTGYKLEREEPWFLVLKNYIKKMPTNLGKASEAEWAQNANNSSGWQDYKRLTFFLPY